LNRDSDKTLPKDFDSDYSLPGRFEESNPDYLSPELPKPRQKNRGILVFMISFVIVSAAFFSYYFINQSEIDSRIIQNTISFDPERNLVNEYGVGKYGSDHAHAAIAVFVNDKKINFGLPHLQLSSKYIHFENNNPYLIHKHATNVPLDMLFLSLGIKVTSDCMVLNYYESETNKGRFCTSQDESLLFYVNGEPYHSDISQYVLNHNDRILISFGVVDSIPEQLAYLDSLRIYDVPNNPPPYSEKDINI